MSGVRVKICGIARLEDVASSVRCGADALGFVFTERSKRHVSVEHAGALIRAVPAFVCRVGLFMDADPEEVRRTLERVAGLPVLGSVSMIISTCCGTCTRSQKSASAGSPSRTRRPASCWRATASGAMSTPTTRPGNRAFM